MSVTAEPPHVSFQWHGQNGCCLLMVAHDVGEVRVEAWVSVDLNVPCVHESSGPDIMVVLKSSPCFPFKAVAI